VIEFRTRAVERQVAQFEMSVRAGCSLVANAIMATTTRAVIMSNADFIMLPFLCFV